MPQTIETLSSPPYSQGHIFDGRSEEENTSLVKQLDELDTKLPAGGLEGYLTRARALLADAKAEKNMFEGLVPKVPEGVKLVGKTGPGSEEYYRYERLGMAELPYCTFCLVAGGLGERLGYPGIKIEIMTEVTTGTTFIQLYTKFILAFQEYARRVAGDASLELPFTVMTSDDTDALTKKLFEENKNFGLSAKQITFMKQEKVPALKDVDARISVKDGKIETKPHGHGDVHSLLHQHGLPKQWLKEGRRWLIIFQDTNPLSFRSMCAILGVSAEQGLAMNSVAVPRIPGESVGGIATLEDPTTSSSLTVNVEYNHLEALLRETAIGGDVADESGFSPYPGNINCLVFDIKVMDKCLEATAGIVPENVNPKWVDSSRTAFKSPTRLECMMQDFPRLCSSTDKVSFTMLERWISKTSVKNNLADAAKKNPPECALTAEADIYACCARMLKLAGGEGKVDIEGPEEVTFLGIKAEIGAKVVLEPTFAISLAQLKDRIQAGHIRITRKSSLVVEGEVLIDGLDLDGALLVSGKGTLNSAKVHNDGCPLVAIPDEELPSQPPSMRIRGYTKHKEAMQHMRIGDKTGSQ